MSKPTSVYQYVDKANRVIYVGITDRRERRATEHERSKSWWPLVAGCVIEHHPTRDEALRREAYLIDVLCPPFNKQLNPLSKEERESGRTQAAARNETYRWPPGLSLRERRALWFTSSEEVKASAPCVRCDGPRLSSEDRNGPTCGRCRNQTKGGQGVPGRHKKQRKDLMAEVTESRSVPFSLVRAEDDGDGLTLAGYAAVFNSPSRIKERGSEFEEQIAPGAFARTLNARERVVLQFDHGSHPFFGSLPLGKFTDMRETDNGLYVEARLHDNWFTHPVRDAIASGAIDGMSFRFSVPEGGDEWDRTGDMPKRTIREVKLVEAGPVVWPAYSDTVVGVRSALSTLTDDQIAQLVDELRRTDDPVTPDHGSRSTKNQRQARVRLSDSLRSNHA